MDSWLIKNNNGALISSLIAVISSIALIFYVNYMPGKAFSFYLWLSILTRSLTLGCIVYISWFAAIQKYQQQYFIGYWLVPIVFVVVTFLIFKLPLVLVNVFGFSTYTVFLIFNIAMGLALVYQAVILKKRVLTIWQFRTIFLLTVIAIIILGVNSSTIEVFKYFPSRSFSSYYLLLFISFLLLTTFLMWLGKNIKGNTCYQLMTISNIQFVFILSILVIDISIIKQLDLGQIKFGNYILLITLSFFVIVKLALVWLYTKQLALPVQPLYILWCLAFSTIFSLVILSGIHYLRLLNNYQLLSYLLKGITVQGLDWHIVYNGAVKGHIVNPIAYMIIGLCMMCFSLTLFFPRNSKQTIV